MCGPRCRRSLMRLLLAVVLVACVAVTAGAPTRALVQNDLGAAAGASVSGTQGVIESGTAVLDGTLQPAPGSVQDTLEGGASSLQLGAEGTAGPLQGAVTDSASAAQGAAEGAVEAVSQGISGTTGTLQDAVGSVSAGLEDGLRGVVDKGAAPLQQNAGLPALGGAAEHPARAAEAAEEQPVPERVLAIIVCDHGATSRTLEALSALGVTGGVVFQHLPMVAVAVEARQLAMLRRVPGVRSVFLDRPLECYLNESVPAIGGPAVWHVLGFTGRGVTVAVVDTGIDATHPDLSFGDKTVENVKVIGGRSLLEGSGLDGFVLPVYLTRQLVTDTTSGHGTHVAGIVAGTGSASTGARNGAYVGVAPGASLVGLGTGEGLSLFSVLEAFDWILANKERYNIRVVNNSWGTSGQFNPDDPINVATRALYDRGIVVVFAAGNSGPSPDTLNPYAVAPWVIGVAAASKEGDLADFSSRGVPGDDLYRPTVTAPGVAIVSARTKTVGITALAAADDSSGIPPDLIPFYTAMSGTSMAAPHVAGVVALMLEANPRLDPETVKEILINTARPMGGRLPYEVGAGLVDAEAAVREALTLDTPEKIRAYRVREARNQDAVDGSWATVAGTLGPSLTYAIGDEVFYTVKVPPRTVRLWVRLCWDSELNDLDLFVTSPDGSQRIASQRFQIMEGGAWESVIVESPAEGAWTVRVRGWLNAPTAYRLSYRLSAAATGQPGESGSGGPRGDAGAGGDTAGEVQPGDGTGTPQEPGSDHTGSPGRAAPGGQTDGGWGGTEVARGASTGQGGPSQGSGYAGGRAGGAKLLAATDNERRNLVWQWALARGQVRAGTFLPVAGGRFLDIADHWAAPTLTLLAELGIVRGVRVAQGVALYPDRAITRAEQVTMLGRALACIEGRPDPAGVPHGRAIFGDVVGHWAEPYVVDLFARGLVRGVPEEGGAPRFFPENQGTRAQAAVLIARSLGLPEQVMGSPEYDVPFVDVRGHWAEGAICSLWQAGLVSGCPGQVFEPDRAITRAEFATLIMRLLASKLSGQPAATAGGGR